MGIFDIFKEKSPAEKARKEEIKEAKEEARDAKKEARQEARDEKREARQEARDEKKDARQDKREEKKDAREEKRDAMKEIRQSDLKGEAKRDAKDEVRDEKKDASQLASQDKKDRIHNANEEKRDEVKSANEEKRQTLDQIREEKRKKLEALRVPKAFDRKWASYLRFQEIDAIEIYKPESLEHLQTICRIATEVELKVRAIGSGHSFSKIGFTNDIFVETQQMNKMLPMGDARKAKLKPGRSNGIAEFEVGRTIFDLSTELEKSGHALLNQGTYDGQTFWGAVSTSTHGSGLGRGPFPSMVLSIVLVGEGGRTFRIEPADGITEPDGWREAGIDELIQDDDVFQSVVCSFGCMGVVYSAVIGLRDFYWLNEWNFMSTWEDFKGAFADEDELVDFVKRWDTISLLVAPTIATKGQKAGVEFAGEHPLSFTLRLETDQTRTIGGTFTDSLAKAFESVGIITGNAPAETKRDLLRLNLSDLKKDDSWLALSATKSGANRGWEGEKFTAEDMDKIPIKRRNKCYKIFPKGGKLFGGYGIELAFPIRRTFEIMELIMERAAENTADGLFHTAPVAIRFVQPAKAYASPQYARHRPDGTPNPRDDWAEGTVMFEVLMAKGSEDGASALAIVESQLLSQPDIRVHWGLSMDQVNDDNFPFAERFPMWDRFVATFRRFNAQKGTFHNAFTDRIGLS